MGNVIQNSTNSFSQTSAKIALPLCNQQRIFGHETNLDTSGL